jgi:hypothetical protein
VTSLRLHRSVFTETLSSSGLHNHVVPLLRACIAGCLRSRCLAMRWYITISFILTQSTPYWTRSKSYCKINLTNNGWCVTVSDIQHNPLIPRIASANTWVHASDYNVTHVSKVVYDPNIDADIPSMQRENFHRKTTQEIYFSELCVIKPRWFCSWPLFLLLVQQLESDNCSSVIYFNDFSTSKDHNNTKPDNTVRRRS